MDSIPTHEQALELLHKHVKTQNLIKHMLATKAFMRVLAKKLGQDEHKWGIAGLLHDIDYDEVKDPNQHSLVGYQILKDLGIDEEICNAVKIHNDHHGILPVTLLDKALQVGETYTGFITACALVQPEKKLASVTVESAMKKFKSKSFAAGANRELMSKSQEMIGTSLEEMIALCLSAMQGISGELGL